MSDTFTASNGLKVVVDNGPCFGLTLTGREILLSLQPEDEQALREYFRQDIPAIDNALLELFPDIDNTTPGWWGRACARLLKKQAAIEAELDVLREAAAIYREASFQSHSGHWDATGEHGAGCPECIEAYNLRAKADALLNKEAKG